MRQRTFSRRKGYALLMALVMLTITALVLVAFARQSLTLATSAAAAEERLQQRWAEDSLRWTLLIHAQEAMVEPVADEADEEVADDDAPEAAPVVRLRTRVVEVDLSGNRYRCVLADESAKASLNTAYRRGGRSQVARLQRELSAASPRLREHLRPYRTSSTNSLPALDSWGQVYELSDVRDQLTGGRDLMGATEHLTCWGDGRLNAHTASDETLKTVARWIVDRRAADRLVQLRKRQSDAEVQQWLEELGVREQQRQGLMELFSDDSSDYSLWIEAQSLHSSQMSFSVYHADRATPRKIDTFRF